METLAPKRAKNKQCTGKVKYPTEETAEKGRVFFHGHHPDFNTYHCPHCFYWHVGHRPLPRNKDEADNYAKADFIDWTEDGDE